MHKVLAVYTKLGVILFNTILLFVIINGLAYLISQNYYNGNLEALYYTPNDILKSNPTLIKHIHNNKPVNEIEALYKSRPNVIAHPVLEFMTEPCLNSYYHIGFENCRYNSLVNASNIQQKINKSTWVFGGSTVFGDGVMDDETITFYLNKLDSTHAYLNFGGLSNHQKMEIEKLVLLLQKGYRPEQVIFLDGLNDVYKITESNFEPHETPNRSVNAYAHNFGLGTLGVNKNLIHALPVVKLFYQYLAAKGIKGGNINAKTLASIDANSLYVTQPILHYYAAEAMVQMPKETKVSSHKMLSYYQSNLLLLEALSKAYHFKYTVFLQPIGPFLGSNIFIKDSVTFTNNFRLYKNVKPVYQFMKQAIENKQLPHYIDISDAHLHCAYPYVDLTHYSASLNLKMAKGMLANLIAIER